jgi:ribose 5-phosphate isomerase B
MIIAFGCDHAGFEQKAALVAYIQAQGHTVADKGCMSAERADYPDHAAAVARAVAAGEAQRGVLICGTGIGMAIAANKIHGIRAANVVSPKFAALAREHNHANVLCLSARFVDESVNEDCIKAFLETPEGEGRHATRVGKIMALEDDC